jgi:rhamnogalacturonyl hydrolase YesR
MAPPLLARLYQITGNQAYIDFLNKEWWQTSDALYSPSAHLFFRDQRYLSRREANGAPIFWARGNGWVVGGLVQILERLPKDDPARPRLEAQFRDMMNAVLLTQQSDGLWRSGLLDASSYELPEVSGSAFFTYGMVWGIRANLLPRKKFEPAARRAWKGMVSHIYADGRLGSIQPIDGEPGYFKPSGSFVYGVGGFLLAGAEIERLLDPSAMRS